ncbi:Porin [Paraburkholderia unamae]|uniref:porin n=1 Tax=Paraburkholderia unamae TaxID=219649 RepID=UPI001CAFA922|nr:porin [Paraburkholderia unamae]CAG9243214.1 Porin [Paraburkholderia unamae]
MIQKAVITTAATFMCLPAAHAQSSVNLYGIVMSGVIWANNVAGGKSTSMAEGPSRWGLRGSEDLGGGTKALFRLESGFAPSTGQSFQGGRLFGRQAYVGLSGDTWGTVTLGRQYDFAAEWLGQTSATSRWNGYFAHPGDNDNFNYQFRVNNAAKYVSPNLHGLELGAMYSFGGVPGSFGNQSAFSLGARYESGPAKLQAAYFHMNHPALAASEGNWSTILFPQISATSPLENNTLNPASMDIYGIGGTYAFGETTLGLVWSHSDYKNLDVVADGLSGANVRFDNIEGNVAYNLTPHVQLVGAYTYTFGKVNQTGFAPQYHQVNAGVNYFLSKRTILYFAGIYQRAAGDATHANIECAGSSCEASSTQNQVSVLGGIFHAF